MLQRVHSNLNTSETTTGFLVGHIHAKIAAHYISTGKHIMAEGIESLHVITYNCQRLT